MKKALQPSVSDLKVKFELPPHIEVTKTPTSIHSIYSGEKIVVYGLLKPKASSESLLTCSGVKGHVTLHGRILGKAINFSLPVDIPPAGLLRRKRLRSPIELAMPLIHQLAAKRILKEWSNDATTSSDHSTKSISLSLDSGVVSEYTAFVAVGENDLPLSNIITVFDISASTTNPYCLIRPAGPCGQRRGTRVKQAARKSTGGMAPRMALPNRVASSTSGLELLVSLQHSTGYWPLKALCDTILKKGDVQVKCPPNVLPNIWATVIALLLLKEKYSERKNEWELVAFKAELWLNDQPLPVDITISSLQSIADTIV